jgi:hypothetical protein
MEDQVEIMAKKQLNIPGTERKEIPEVEAAAEAYREVRDDRCELSKKEAQKKLELLAVMRANKIKIYRYPDENGEELEVLVDDEPKVKLRKTGEADVEIGEGFPIEADAGPSDGLVNQALRSQAEAGVEVTADGDVVVPETSAPKGKKKAKKKAKPS